MASEFDPNKPIYLPSLYFPQMQAAAAPRLSATTMNIVSAPKTQVFGVVSGPFSGMRAVVSPKNMFLGSKNP